MPHALLALTIVIRVYSSSASAPALDRALAEAATVLAPVAIEPEWVQCGALGAAAACASPLATAELAVRFSNVPVAAGYAGRLPLGDSLVDRNRHRGVLATIYSERVVWLARAAGVDPARLLGRALAHEIVHLLLGSQRHADSGLMRAVWTREDLERDRPSDWTFTKADAQAIRTRAMTLESMRLASNHEGRGARALE